MSMGQFNCLKLKGGCVFYGVMINFELCGLLQLY